MDISLLQSELVKFGITSGVQIKIVKTFFIVFVLIFIRSLISRFLSHKASQNEVLYRWEKIISYSFYACSFLIIANIWFRGIQSLATFFGLLSAGLAVAFKDYLSNIAGWFYILWMEPCKVGHRIQLGNIVGDIIDIGPVHISLLEVGNFANAEQPTGKVVFIPNSQVFSHSISNYDISFPYIWHEIQVIVTFESDWRRAKEIVYQTVKNNSLVYDEKTLRKFKVESKNFLFQVKSFYAFLGGPPVSGLPSF